MLSPIPPIILSLSGSMATSIGATAPTAGQTIGVNAGATAWALRTPAWTDASNVMSSSAGFTYPERNGIIHKYLAPTLTPNGGASTSKDFNITWAHTAGATTSDNDNLEHFVIGYNLNWNGQPEVAGHHAFGMLWETTWPPPSNPGAINAEWHGLYFDTSGNQRRIWSFTADTAKSGANGQPEIDMSLEGNRWTYKQTGSTVSFLIITPTTGSTWYTPAAALCAQVDLSSGNYGIFRTSAPAGQTNGTGWIGRSGTNNAQSGQLILTDAGDTKLTANTGGLFLTSATSIVSISAGSGQDIQIKSRLLFSDAINLAFNTTTGTKIGTAANQRLSFHNATPTVQYATTGTAAGFTAGAGSAVDSAATFTGNNGSTAYTISDIVNCLKTKGLMAA